MNMDYETALLLDLMLLEMEEQLENDEIVL